MQRLPVNGSVPLVTVSGTAKGCGLKLGTHWKEFLQDWAKEFKAVGRYWLSSDVQKAFERYAPHLVGVIEGLAEGAGIRVEPKEKTSTPILDGCTSWSVSPNLCLDNQPLSGQIKDTHPNHVYFYQVLKLQVHECPTMLVLTVPGVISGVGFVAGGCSVFRNSLRAGKPKNGLLTQEQWSLLALHCSSVDEVKELTLEYGIDEGFHATVTDESGGVLGVEASDSGYSFLESHEGLYVHTNHLLVKPQNFQFNEEPVMGMHSSELRLGKIRELLEQNAPHLTPQTIYAAAMNTEGYPYSLNSDNRPLENYASTAFVISEPSKGYLHVCNGMPSQNWPVTYSVK